MDDQVLYDQLIEFARDKQRGRRHNTVHQSVPNPMFVLVLGDSLCETLDALYVQLTSRWSSQLEALQICYCYMNSPYQGDYPVLQAKVGNTGSCSGAGCLCSMPESLAEVNKMVTKAIDRFISVPQIPMLRADVSVILSAEDAAATLLLDMVALVKGRLEDFGTVNNDSRLYLLLPQRYDTEEQRSHVRCAMEQIRQAAGPEKGGTAYEQNILQPQLDAAPRGYRSEHLLNGVMLLDDMNELYQKYNLHGERLQLLGDLIETRWSAADYIQTAGVQEGTAGPEYWLAQAADTQCSAAQKADSDNGASLEKQLRSMYESIGEMAGRRMSGLERAMSTCCLYLRGKIGRVREMSLDSGERAVFGNSLQNAYTSWLESLPPVQIPQDDQQTLDTENSDERLEALASALKDWADECERKCVLIPESDCRKFNAKSENEAENVAVFRKFLHQMKYSLMRKNDEMRYCAEIARQCAKGCRQRIDELKSEREEFAEFSRAIHQTWVMLRDSYNNGMEMPVNWLETPPSAEKLRKMGAEAARSGDASKPLAVIADCIDLAGSDESRNPVLDPPLYCRITVNIGLPVRRQVIEKGISAGRVLKFATIAHEYDEEKIRLVFALLKAY